MVQDFFSIISFALPHLNFSLVGLFKGIVRDRSLFVQFDLGGLIIVNRDLPEEDRVCRFFDGCGDSSSITFQQ
jgi:hypothetical protein